MLKVFPETMDKLQEGDVKKSITELERYIRYMTERIEFAVNTLDKKIDNKETEESNNG